MTAVPPNLSDGIGNSLVVGRNDDALDQRCLLDTPVNVFYQGLSFDFNYWFSRETGGIESGRDDRYGGIRPSSKHRTSILA